jgi:hypothetical protein
LPENEHELSLFNRKAYEAFKLDPEVRSLFLPVSSSSFFVLFPLSVDSDLPFLFPPSAEKKGC